MSELTPDDLARLRLPLDGLGLDPVGLDLHCPVRVDGVEAWLRWPCLYSDAEDGPCVYTGSGLHPLHAGWRVDAGSSATRDRLVRRLAGSIDRDEPAPCTAPYFSVVRAPHPEGWWVIGTRSRTRICRPGQFMPERFGHVDREIPALAGLSPHDDRRLSDGSRWVDAVVLAEACRFFILEVE